MFFLIINSTFWREKTNKQLTGFFEVAQKSWIENLKLPEVISAGNFYKAELKKQINIKSIAV